MDDAGQDVAERQVGRLIFRGPSMTPGYFAQPEATAAISLPGGWLDSGDLAYRADGELHVAGRRKDLIIKGGRNLVPQEIEELAGGVPGVRRGCVAAFGVTEEAQGTERLVIVAETRDSDAAEREAADPGGRERGGAVGGASGRGGCWWRPARCPKTSCGKIRRAETRPSTCAATLGRPRAAVAGRARLLLAAARTRPSRRPWPASAAGSSWPGARWSSCPACWPSGWSPRWRQAGGHRGALARTGSWLGLRLLGARFETSGLERLRQGGPFVLVCNHTSYADIPLLLALLPVDFAFVAKREAADWPLAGLFIRRSGHLTVDRRDAQDSLAATGRVAAALRSGRSVLVFPEATFRAASGLRPFRLGAFKTAVELGVPVLPLAIAGTRRRFLAGRTLATAPGPDPGLDRAPIARRGRRLRARDRVPARPRRRDHRGQLRRAAPRPGRGRSRRGRGR